MQIISCVLFFSRSAGFDLSAFQLHYDKPEEFLKIVSEKI